MAGGGEGSAHNGEGKGEPPSRHSNCLPELAIVSVNNVRGRHGMGVCVCMCARVALVSFCTYLCVCRCICVSSCA